MKQDSEARKTVEALYAVYILPIVVAYPVFWAVTRWKAWEAAAWFVALCIGGYCYIRTRGRERQRKRETDSL